MKGNLRGILLQYTSLKSSPASPRNSLKGFGNFLKNPAAGQRLAADLCFSGKSWKSQIPARLSPLIFHRPPLPNLGKTPHLAGFVPGLFFSTVAGRLLAFNPGHLTKVV